MQRSDCTGWSVDSWPHFSPAPLHSPTWPQNWCIKRRSQSIYLQVLTDKHAPEHYRSAPPPLRPSPLSPPLPGCLGLIPPCVSGAGGVRRVARWGGKGQLGSGGTYTLWVSS